MMGLPKLTCCDCGKEFHVDGRAYLQWLYTKDPVSCYNCNAQVADAERRLRGGWARDFDAVLFAGRKGS